MDDVRQQVHRMQDQIDSLDRRVRRWQKIAGVVALTAIGVLCLGAGTPLRVLDVRVLRIVDEAGRPRIVLGSMGASGTQVMVQAVDGSPLVSLGELSDGSGAIFVRGNGPGAVFMKAGGEEEKSTLSVMGGADGEPAITMTARNDGSQLRLEGTHVAELWQSNLGELGPGAGLTLYADEQEARANLTTLPGGSPFWIKGAKPEEAPEP